MQIDEPNNLQEQLIANKLLLVGAASMSTHMDRLASWLLVAFGAAFALIVSNIDGMSNYLKVDTIIDAGRLFLVAGVLEIPQKFIAAHVASSVRSSSEVEEMFLKHGNAIDQMDKLTRVLDFVREGLWGPAKWTFQLAVAKSSTGDYTFLGKLAARLSEAQRIIVLIETFFLVWAAIMIVSDLGQVPFVAHYL